MSGSYEKAAANVTLPTATYSDSYPATGVNTGGLDFGAIATGVSLLGKFVWLKSDQKAHLRTSSAAIATGSQATTGDIWIEPNTDYSFRVNNATRYLSVAGAGTAGTLYVARSDEAPT